MKLITLLGLMTVAAAGTMSFAQPDEEGPPSGPGGPGGDHHRPPPPVIAALDLNRDGTIDADEIAKASKSLLTLDKNGDGKLTPDELHPHPPPPSDGQGPGAGRRPGGRP